MTTTNEPAPPPSLLAGEGPLAAFLAFLFTTLFVLTTTLTPIRSDNDVWWHVKTGKVIAEQGLPEYDVFSYTAADHEWHNHEWLTQLAFWYAWKAGDAAGFGGFRAVIAFKAFIVWLTVMAALLLAHALARNWWAALLVAVLVVAIGRRMFYVRPPIVTNLLMLGEIFLLVAVAEGWLRRRWALLLVPMIALWTNLHGGWMAGGVIFAAWGVDQLAALLRSKLPRLPLAFPKQVLAFPMLAGMGILLVLATLVNPYIYKLYLLPGRVLGDRNLVTSIGELASPNFYYVIDFEFFAIHGMIVMALMLRNFRPRLWEVLIYLFFLHQAIQHVRHLSLFSIAMVPLYARVAGALLEGGARTLREWEPPFKLAAPVRGALPGAALGALAIGTLYWVTVNPREGGQMLAPFSQTGGVAASYPARNLQYLRGMGYDRTRFPFEVATLIEEANLDGRMYNENYYAGYLIWRLAPEDLLVFSDPRFDIFGGKILRAEQEISRGRTDLLDEFHIDWLITRRSAALSLILEDDPGWLLGVGFPNGFEIWFRDDEENRVRMQRARNAAALAGGFAP